MGMTAKSSVDNSRY